ncbi:hypothetical protein BN2537_10941 [Streptomyces venezuelae]|nr:hypothetical protein BN2537_10941 [Streptomyces venezuelae]
MTLVSGVSVSTVWTNRILTDRRASTTIRQAGRDRYWSRAPLQVG